MQQINFYFLTVIVFPVLLFLSAKPVAAHPHVFIAQDTKIVFDEKGLAGFKIYWAFDEMFSVMIAEDFDKDQNGTLGEQEIATIKEKAFSYIAPYNYYIHIKIEGNPFTVKFITDFNATLNKGKLSYEFFIPCHVTAEKNPKNIVLSPYDPEYYSDIYFPNEKLMPFEKAEAFIIETKIKRDMSTLIYYETVNPLAIFLNFKLK
ncbi:DUF1007 family protein [uncultured Desulfobacter sp.]|uniref:DUF1007 family protein n=1 Tax=uncultured Desulfobacter sp. TaxID=240139 RepID=UPI002AABF164|nr:DUF1007 family protein [uncultured Desulfobacter sp.]